MPIFDKSMPFCVTYRFVYGPHTRESNHVGLGKTMRSKHGVELVEVEGRLWQLAVHAGRS